MLVSKKHKKLVLNLRDPGRVTSVIPSARTLQYKGRTFVAVPHRTDEVRVLRNLGLEAPAPMDSYYDWPGRYPPFAHQRTTAGFLSTNPRAFCLNGMGAGKTLSALWAYDYLRRSGEVDWMVVVSPLSTLERAWGDEIYRHFPDMRFVVLHGSREKRLKLLASEQDIYIINHDGIKGKDVLAALTSKPGRGLVIVDEIAVARNPQTELWKALNLLINGNERQGIAGREWAWGLTGTPIPNAPTDAWAQCRLINPARVGKYFGHFRDAVMRQLTQFKWVAREGALDTVHESMQPAIRFAREDCIDLPPTTHVTRQADLTPDQKAAFDAMLRKFRAEHEGGEITAVNEAVKLSKLLQICCLRYDTPTLTQRGWVEIQHVHPDDLVWDGVEWVSHDGAQLMGHKTTVECGGVHMTEDHQVLSSSGWVTAKEFNHGNASKRLDWAEVRLPDSGGEGGQFGWRQSKGAVAVPLRMRHRGYTGEPVPADETSHPTAELWVPPRQSDPFHVTDTPVPHLVQHAGSVPGRSRQGLGKLRGAGHNGVRRLARFVSAVLGRYAGGLRLRVDSGASGKRRPVFPWKLSVGDPHTAEQQSPLQHCGGHPLGHNDDVRSRTSVRHQTRDALRQSGAVRVAAGEGTTHPRVYDIVNCGPRNRFVVRGNDGAPRIVHNCGVAYGADGSEITIPAGPRIQLVRDIIHEAEAKVLVFVPFTAALKVVAQELAKDFTVEVVYGGVTKTQRDQIFSDFQQAKNPRVIVADARTMAHGITLTAANTVIWYAPPYSAEIYQQACARVTRPGQKLNTLTVNVEATPMERKVYDRLQGKERLQGLLLEMLKAA